MDGALGATFTSLAPGDHAAHSYTISFTSGNLALPLGSATVSYIAESGSTETQASACRVGGRAGCVAGWAWRVGVAGGRPAAGWACVWSRPGGLKALSCTRL